MAIELTTVSSGYNLSAINENFESIESALNDNILWRTGNVAGEAMMTRDLDMNGHTILNLAADPSNPGSILTRALADSLYYNIVGDVLEGDMDAGQHRLTNLAAPSGAFDATRKKELDSEVLSRQNADANIQEQLTGNVPLEASAFSEISWHGQQIANSVTIPADKNAWSFGPQMEILEGQAVTVSDGASWTIADGRVVEDEDLHQLIADTIRTTDGSVIVDVNDLATGSSVASLTARMTAEETKVQPVSLGGTGNTTGVAPTATALATARTVQTNLASASAASFDGTANISPGVTGILPITNGGTGNATGLAASATILATSRTLQTNLASTSATSFNGSANITLGVTGTLPIANGGTGGATAAAARTALGAAASGANTDITSLAGNTAGIDAAAGKVGEVLTNTTSAVAITSNVSANVASLSLTAGDWEIVGTVQLVPTGTTLSQIQGALGTTSAALATFPQRYQLVASTSATAEFPVPTLRLNVSATTTVYLVAATIYSGGSVQAQGYIRARRAR